MTPAQGGAGTSWQTAAGTSWQAAAGSSWQAAAGPAQRGEFLNEHAAGERQLLDAARRTTAPGWAALVLHVADFPPPGARPHHRRVARAILDDTVQRHGGQVFSLRNGDLVMLGPSLAVRAPAALRSPPLQSETLPQLLLRLLQADVLDPARLVSTWMLPEARDRLLAYATERLADGGLSAVEKASSERAAGGPGLEREQAVGEPPPLPDLLHRQTAVLLGGSNGARLLPLFREIGFADAALQAQAGGESLEADPFLLRHLAMRLGVQVLMALPTEFGRHGALDAASGPRLHVNLPPTGILSDGFAQFSALCRAGGVALGVEVSLVEAAADPVGMAAARALLDDRNVAFVLDEVSHLAMQLTNPAALEADLVKLDWANRLPDLPMAEQHRVDAALGRIGVERVVLAGADGEAALRWGLRRGIRRFQGRHVDAMLGASRISACASGGGCSLRQCIERASAVAPAGRLGCRNLALLDAAAPAETRAVSAA